MKEVNSERGFRRIVAWKEGVLLLQIGLENRCSHECGILDRKNPSNGPTERTHIGGYIHLRIVDAVYCNDFILVQYCSTVQKKENT